MIRAFETSFVTQYQVAFTELVRLGSVASQKKVDGKDTKFEDSKAERIFTILQALDSEGLTAKEIEALEYCLISLNDSLVVASVPEIVTVSPEAHVPVVYRLRAWAGLFNLSFQSFNVIRPYILVAERGSFALNGQDVIFNTVRHMAAERGSFALGGQDVGLTYVPYVPPTPPYDLEMSLAEAVASAPTWEADFDGEVLSVTGNGSTDTGTLVYASGTVNVTVHKVSNGGITEDAGDVTFLINGAADGPPTSFLVGANYDGGPGNIITHTFTGLSAGDTLKVEIVEG